MILQLHKDFNPIVSPLWSCTYYSLTNVKARSLCGLVLTGSVEGLNIWWVNIKDQEGKDRRRQLLCYVSLIRACNKVL